METRSSFPESGRVGCSGEEKSAQAEESSDPDFRETVLNFQQDNAASVFRLKKNSKQRHQSMRRRPRGAELLLLTLDLHSRPSAEGIPIVGKGVCAGVLTVACRRPLLFMARNLLL